MVKKSTKSSDSSKGATGTSGGAKREILFRVRMLYLLFILVGFGVAARLVWVQMFSGSVAHNAEVLKEDIVREIDIPAHRGAILTRDGEPLAMSSLRYEPLFDFKADGFHDASAQDFERNVDSLSKLLARHFSPEDALSEGYDYISAAEYRDIFHKEYGAGKARAKSIFPRSVTLDEWNMMTADFPILNHNMGVVYSVNPVEKRIRPLGDMAYQFIGRHTTIVVDSVTKHGSGIEGMYNDYLAGKSGRAKEQYIAHGFWSRLNDPYNMVPVDGCDVVTTIDGGLQNAATEILRRELEALEASFGVAMVMEVESGDLLCMVNLSSGEERGTNYSETEFNHALKTSQCPGSTFKLAASMVLAEHCGFTANTTVEIPSRETVVGTRLVRDSHTITYENGNQIKSVPLKDGFAHSSNIFFAKAVYENFKDRPKQYWEYLNALGFNSTVGLDAYEEESGYIPEPLGAEWKKIHGSIGKSLPYLGYGYIAEVPPIHTLTFYNGVANRGRMMAPRLVDRVERDGEVIIEEPVRVLNEKMCSDATIEVLYECLAAAADTKRTKRCFEHLPFNIGCKTGTAEIQGEFHSKAIKDRRVFDAGMDRDDGYNLGSVVCMMPLERPKYTIMVAVLKQRGPWREKIESHNGLYVRPSDNPRFGIDVAGPAASQIMLYLYNNDIELHPAVEEAPSPYTPTSIKGGSSESVDMVSGKFASYVSDEAGAAAWCKATSDVGGNITISNVDIADVVPDVRDMGLSDALYLLEDMGMVVTHEGVGGVIEQSIDPGTSLVECEGVIHLKLGIKRDK